MNAASLVRDWRHASDRHREIGGSGGQGLILRHATRGFHDVVTRLSRDRQLAVAQEAGRLEKRTYGVSEDADRGLIGGSTAEFSSAAVDGVVLTVRVCLGRKSLLSRVREMPPDQIARIQMMPVCVHPTRSYGRRSQDAPRPRRARLSTQPR